MDDFFKLVKDMRDAQKEYFKNKQYHTFEKAIKLERQVDNEIKKQLNPNLFS